MTQKVSDERLGKFARKQNDWFRRVREGSLDPKEVEDVVQMIIDRGGENKILSRLYSGETVLVGATDSTETIANSGKIFNGFLDKNFKKWGTNKPSGRSTEPTPARVYELQQNATFQDMFYSLGRDIDELCWEQGQIINFCREHRDKLHPKGWGNLFLFKVKGEENPLVAHVLSGASGLRVDVSQFGDIDVWVAESRLRVVVPQLKP